MKRGQRKKAGEILLLALLAMFAIGTAPRRRARAGPRVKLSLAELRDLAARAGFPASALDVSAAVAMAESRGYPSAAHIVTPLQAAAMNQLPERSFGLWQINTLAHPEYDESKLLDADYNARAAFAISVGGTDWDHWSVHNPGPHGEPPAYLQFMPGGANYA
jgi:hypothetical protein